MLSSQRTGKGLSYIRELLHIRWARCFTMEAALHAVLEKIWLTWHKSLLWAQSDECKELVSVPFS